MTTLTSPRTLTLSCHPDVRPQVSDLRELLQEAGELSLLRDHRRILAISHHTTAGFPDRALRRRIGTDRGRLDAFLSALGDLFPPDAGYHHDQLQFRDELSEEQKKHEPLNADAHLAFIGGGFTNCAEYNLSNGRSGGASTPLWFVDFDGVYPDREGSSIQRTRRTTFVGYDREERVTTLDLEVPVPETPAALDLSEGDPSILAPVLEAMARHGITHGRMHLRLTAGERDAGLTVNEYEALLMTRDLVELFESPLRYADDPGTGARALLSALEALRISQERRVRLRDRILSRPSPRLLRVPRDLRIPILPRDPGQKADTEPDAPGAPSSEVDASSTGENPGGTSSEGRGVLVQGRYQSPILVQWAPPPTGVRTLRATLWRFR